MYINLFETRYSDDCDEYSWNYLNCVYDKEYGYFEECGMTVGDMCKKLENNDTVYLVKPSIPATMSHITAVTKFYDGKIRPEDKLRKLEDGEVFYIIRANKDKSNVIDFIEL